MQTNTITGELNLTAKQVKFTAVSPIVMGENRTTLIKIAIPFELQSFDVYFLLKENNGNTVITPKLVLANGQAEYLLVNSALTKTGTVSFQLIANKTTDGFTQTFKSLINQQLSVSGGLNENTVFEETPNIIAEAQAATNSANSVAQQLLLDKEMGVFTGIQGIQGEQGIKGDTGDKGDPSTLDKLGTASAVIDLTDIENGVFGTVASPLTVTENTTISFVNLCLAAGYQKSFILYVKRTADVAVIWQNITKWAFDEISLLPVGKTQKILVETVDGTNYYGTEGDVFNV